MMKHGQRWGTLDPFFEEGDMLGRRVANAGFVRALFDADPFEEYHFFLPSQGEAAAHQAFLEKSFPRLGARGAFICRSHLELPGIVATTPFSCFHLSDCFTHTLPLMKVRNMFAPDIFPVTSVTHSLSYERYMPRFFEHIWSGVTVRDRLVATSSSATKMLEATFKRLICNYGLSGDKARYPLPALIPLGTDLSLDDGSGAEALRRKLDIGDKLVFLSLSRISVHSKMDVLPIFAALQRAHAMGLQQGAYVFILAGWSEEDSTLPEALQNYAKRLGIRMIPVLRPSEAEKQALFHVADIFLSPADNIQETFGLTLLEAGAAGLPSIVSDFDGYRDIIVDGETGFLIPTLGNVMTAETNVLAGIWKDNQYHLKLAQQTAVNLPCFAQKLALLATTPQLREEMGTKARQRITSLFSWECVIEQYIALWNALRTKPISGRERSRLVACAHPMQADFAHSFASHYSRVLDEEMLQTVVVLSPAGDAIYRQQMPLVTYAGQEYMLDESALRRVLLAARRPASLSHLMAVAGAVLQETLPGHLDNIFIHAERAAFIVLWALKHGYLDKESDTHCAN